MPTVRTAVTVNPHVIQQPYQYRYQYQYTLLLVAHFLIYSFGRKQKEYRQHASPKRSYHKGEEDDIKEADIILHGTVNNSKNQAKAKVNTTTTTTTCTTDTFL